MELETINRLYLELSQFVTAKTKRELELEELLRSACAIAERKGEGTHWGRFQDSIQQMGLNGVTARTYRMLEGETKACRCWCRACKQDKQEREMYAGIVHADGVGRGICIECRQAGKDLERIE